jgi:hypothetical protein
MKRIVYLSPVFALICSLSFNGCSILEDDRKGACVTSVGCSENVTPGQCDMLEGTFYQDKTCAQRGY